MSRGFRSSPSLTIHPASKFPTLIHFVALHLSPRITGQPACRLFLIQLVAGRLGVEEQRIPLLRLGSHTSLSARAEPRLPGVLQVSIQFS